jgi:hypothetical protein
MPQITPQARASATSQTGDAWVAPHKSLKAAATGMILPEPKPDKDPKNGQVTTGKEDGSLEETITLSPQMTAMARKEQKFRQQEQAFKVEKEAFTAKAAAAEKFEALQAKIAAKDFSILEELGVTYQDYANYQINKGEAGTPENQAIQKLETKVDDLNKKREDDINKQYDATLAQYRKEAATFLSDKTEEYEGLISEATLAGKKPEEFIVTHIAESFAENDEELTVEQAAKEIEDIILEDALRKASFKKVQEKIGVPPKKTLPPPKTGLKTLTASIAPSTESGESRGQFQHLSPKERLAQAVARSQRQG